MRTEAVVASGLRVREVADPKCRCAGVGRPRWILESPRSALPGPCKAPLRHRVERLRAAVDDLFAVFEESLRQRPTGAVAAFDRPHSVGPGFDVLAHRGVAGLVGGEPPRAKQLLVMVDDLDGGRQLVGIDPDDDVLQVLLPPVLVPDVDGEVGIPTTSRAVPS